MCSPLTCFRFSLIFFFAVMPIYNLYFAWCWILIGLLTGTVQGLFFHHETWLGGYGSWERRMTRLGHVAFFGTGVLNLCFAATVILLDLEWTLLWLISSLLILGAVTMSGTCYLSAWHKPLRHLFFIPVLSLIAAVGLVAVSFTGLATAGM